MTQLFLLNLFLAAVFVILSGNVSLLGFAVAFAIGMLVIGLYAQAAGQGSYLGKWWRLVRFLVYFIYILVKANVQVAWEIITPKMHMQPRIVRMSVAGMTEIQITTLANAITLTPGTLSADIDEDRELLYVHCMYAKSRQAALADLEELKRRLMREVFAA